MHPRAWLGNPHGPWSPPHCSSASCIRFHSALSVWRNLLLPWAISSGPGLDLCTKGLRAYTGDRDTHKIQILISFINQTNSFHPALSDNFPVSIVINTEQLVCPSLDGRDNVIYVSADEKACLLLNSQKHAALTRKVL